MRFLGKMYDQINMILMEAYTLTAFHRVLSNYTSVQFFTFNLLVDLGIVKMVECGAVLP